MSICPRVPGWVQSLFGQCLNVLPNIWNGQYRGAAAVPLFHFCTFVLSQIVQDLLYTVVHPLIPSSSLSSSLCFSLYLCLRFNLQFFVPHSFHCFGMLRNKQNCSVNLTEGNAFQCTHATTPLHWTEAIKYFFLHFSPSSKWVWSARSMFLLNSVAKKCARRSKNVRGRASRSWKAAPLCPNSCTPVDTALNWRSLHC